jgi:hypothetical protein
VFPDLRYCCSGKFLSNPFGFTSPHNTNLAEIHTRQTDAGDTAKGIKGARRKESPENLAQNLSANILVILAYSKICD